ncbi:MAG TPA: carboxymuconolactone decarboxylase family protein [Streptosporangiaceae bacterium]|jgi:AhpD family alkylhydroperoxidase
MEARMKNPAGIIPEATQAIKALAASFHGRGVPEETLALIHLRASQINGCSSCVAAGAAGARKAGETEERLATVAAWRDAPYFTDADRAALALTEAVTRLADRPDPVPDEIWDEAARHYDEKGLAVVLLAIAATNVFNRLNAPTRQVAGVWA